MADSVKESHQASSKPASGENPNSDPTDFAGNAPSGDVEAATYPPSRIPFTNLSQVDADLALARALQEQETAFMMLRSGGGGYGEMDEYEEEDEDFQVEEDYDEDVALEDHIEEGELQTEELGSEYDGGDDGEHDVNPGNLESDEAYALSLQEAEGRGIAARFMALAGLGGWIQEGSNDNQNNPQDAWENVDPDEYSYEEMIALGEVAGTESKGISADILASLPFINYKAESPEDGNSDQCVICRLDYEDGESLVLLSCKHMYHPGCISTWLHINKICPVCNAEVSTSST